MPEVSSVSFWNSELLTSIVTLVVGLFVFMIYKKRQRDKKKDAANIILLEIKNAEEQLGQAKEIMIRDKALPESIFAARISSWYKYRHLFVRDLTDEEWSLINKFYEKCRQYDEVVKYNNTFFKKNEEQIRVNLHQSLSEYTKSYLTQTGKNLRAEDQKDLAKRNKEVYEEYLELLSGFYESFMSAVTSHNSQYFYRPDKTIQDAEAIINTVKLDLSTSTIGIKLQSIVDQNFRSRLFKLLAGKK